MYVFRDKMYTFLRRMKDPCGAFRCDFIFIFIVFNKKLTLYGCYILCSFLFLSLVYSYESLFMISFESNPYPSFRMHDAGEIDVRACYTAISVSHLSFFLSAYMLEIYPSVPFNLKPNLLWPKHQIRCMGGIKIWLLKKSTSPSIIGQAGYMIDNIEGNAIELTPFHVSLFFHKSCKSANFCN